MSFNKYGSKFLKGFRNYRVDAELSSSVIEEFLQSLDCPRALSVVIMLRHNEHDQIANLSFDPLAYPNWVSLRDAYAATKFLSKYKGFTLGYDLDEVAKAKFKEFELRCERTNYRFSNPSSDPLYMGASVRLHTAVVHKIERLLGDFSAEEFFSNPNWGPGASTLIPRRRSSSQEKFQCETGITRDLHSLIPTELMQKIYPAWSQHLIDIGFPVFQVGNKVITVPKDSSTNRVIAVEPGINLWFQKAIGDMIGSRLLRVGIDLTNQGRNQQLALIGSKTGEYATVDLSSASDSIASSVVEALLPQRWFSVLDSCRTRFGQLDGEVIKWEKFSSMGNGFTFPLQTLIFFAVAKCCVEDLHVHGDVSVYGDDVVLPTSAFKLFTEMVAFYGFQVNEKKSHSCSTFRESCGAHYCSGFDIKPIYLKDRLSSVPAIYRLANSVRRLAHRWLQGADACEVRFRPAFDHLVRSVPVAFRFRVPEGFGDGGFISNFDEATPSRAKDGVEGYHFYHVADVSLTHEDLRLGYELTALWRISERLGIEDFELKRPTMLKAIRNLTILESDMEGRNSVPSHDTVWRVVKSMARQWPDLGPWL
jgi:hypothetical protein